MNTRIRLTATLSLLALASCGGGGEAPDDAQSPGDAAQAPDGASMPATAWSATPIEGAVDVIDLRESAESGDEVVVRGTLKDFGSFANFALVEDSLDDCNEKGEPGHCAEPWDYCCEDPEKLRELTVSVEFEDGSGDVADWTLQGANGLDRLDEVVAMGTLEIDEDGNMRLRATRMSRQ